ncbi:LysR substrate-binding domain-containing protein [Methylocaldum sp.]|jgi:DNA-binding transcriptional LysR family regulator|uniref:LysR substrate-binding domain-containing protein n=1 Tax=unclassified Methylocaldum TaxID=2622260 RepID=UPI0012EBC079|nr:LysR family transcriptional regulator [Methylocaldum sp. BRCS4]
MIENINEIDFRKADLNLLPVFSALLKERSVTRAAGRLYLGQPAVSAALMRLREMFKDELFLRTAKGMEPTARALELAEQLGPALEIIHREMYGTPRFDPATAERSFRLGMPDSIEVALSPSLIERIQREAPGVRVAIRLAGHEQGAKLLDNQEIDLGVSRFTDVASWHRQENLYREGYVCLFDGARLGIPSPIGLEDYLALPHLLMSFSGGFEGVVDEALARRNLRRRVLLSTTRFSALPFILKEADAIATLPASMARRCAEAFKLTLSPAPIEIETFTVSMLWHARHDRDPGHIWLREAVKSIVRVEANPSIDDTHRVQGT